MNRIAREQKVVSMMIASYCRIHHKTDGKTLCDDCQELRDYALDRLTHCPKGIHKTSCRKCDIHCYAHRYRARIRNIMRYMGPRMLLISPIATIRHLWDEMK
ncbi:MAG: nitrous oxide-stimulated promoter family protein [Duncaniella sp.]|nr:nitrous oxide-stimulated promoter family protein [Duncaniella sp.]